MEQVIIKDYDQNWAIQFAQEKQNIQSILANAIVDIEHIGSTSIIGLAAKPVLDIAVAVNHLDDTAYMIEPLKKLQYEFVEHNDFPHRRFFRKGQWRAGTHHLHVYQMNSESWHEQLLFRDYLRKHSNVRKEYERIKRALANKYRFNRVAYTEAKAPFIQHVVERAKEEQ